MIRLARQLSQNRANIDFRIADVLTWDFPSDYFDCIVSIATLHHLPLETILLTMRQALKVNGTLIVLDLFEPEGLSDSLMSAAALPIAFALRLARTGQLRESREIREAWAEHGQNDSYLTIPQVRQACAEILPGARVRRHLLWRYSIVWKKTAALT